MSLRAVTEHRLRRSWQRRGALAQMLLPLAALHGRLLALRRMLYRHGWLGTQRLPVPVVVVGNVVAGGAGKTPTTLALAQHLQQAGWHPGIVSRGHGRHTRDVRPVTPQSSPHEVGDEPLLLQRRSQCPVWVGARRADAGRALLATHPEVNILLCDDGLQHLALARNVEICVFDARGPGNGWLLPAGPLREPWPRPVDLVLWTETPPQPPPAPHHQARRQLASHALHQNGSPVPLHSLRGQPVTALAAIARPEAFFDMLRQAELELGHTIALADHDPIAQRPPGLTEHTVVLCTEKDAPKLWPHCPNALAVPLELDLPPGFVQALDGLLAGRQSDFNLNEAEQSARHLRP